MFTDVSACPTNFTNQRSLSRRRERKLPEKASQGWHSHLYRRKAKWGRAVQGYPNWHPFSALVWLRLALPTTRKSVGQEPRTTRIEQLEVN